MSQKNILITGVAGFIGFHVARRLLECGYKIVGVDNLNDYYDPSLKNARLAFLTPSQNFHFVKVDVADRTAVEKLFSENLFDDVIHLAAQAGVRHSIKNPHVYIQSNIMGFMNILEGCRSQWCLGALSIKNHLVYASSSSVYGFNTKMPFSTNDNTDRPASLYGATKKANELMAYTYSCLYGIPTTGLRFFTVYGPWGRPDMALFKFTKAILAGEPIDVYNDGKMQRDFTYVDDIVEGIIRIIECVPSLALYHCDDRNNKAVFFHSRHNFVPYKLYNIGNNSPVGLMDFIATIEDVLGKKAKINFLVMQPGDVPATYADVDDLIRDIGFAPKTPIQEGIRQFVEWYRSFYLSS